MEGVVMQYEMKGTVHQVMDTQQITDKFKKREFVLFVENTNNPLYSDYIKFEAVQDKCDDLDSLKQGMHVDVKFFISGRKVEKEGKDTMYFTSLKIADFAIQQGEKSSNNNVGAEVTNDVPQEPPQMSEDKFDNGGEEDDLPF